MTQVFILPLQRLVDGSILVLTNTPKTLPLYFSTFLQSESSILERILVDFAIIIDDVFGFFCYTKLLLSSLQCLTSDAAALSVLNLQQSGFLTKI